MSVASLYTTTRVGSVRVGVHYTRTVDGGEDCYQVLSVHAKDDGLPDGNIWPLLSGLMGAKAEDMIVGALIDAREN